MRTAEPSLVSQAGAGWAKYYESGPSWVRPEAVDTGYLDSMLRSEWVRRLLALARLRERRESAVLEAGCGVGLYALCLARLGYRVQAFDYNAAAIRIAEQLRGQAGFSAAQVQFAVDNLLAIHAPAESFDLVFNQSVMEYFCDDAELDRALRELVRVLKPGGRLVLILQNTKHPLYAVKRRFGWRWYANQPPVRLISARELAGYLEGLGLVELRVDGIDPWKGMLNGIPFLTRVAVGRRMVGGVSAALARLVPLPPGARSRLGVQFIVAARKPGGGPA